jgi:uncharacterized protein (TIGR02266 family)
MRAVAERRRTPDDRRDAERRENERRENERRHGDRRASPRVELDVWVEQRAGDDLYIHRAANLSEGGAYFARTVPFPVGTRVHLRLTLPDAGEPIECWGEVVTARGSDEGPGMGVRFLRVSAEDRGRIKSAIAGRR